MAKWTCRYCLILLALTVGLGQTCHAGELLEARAERRDDHFLLHVDMRIQGKAKDVYRVLLDFKHLPEINDSIKSAEELSHEGKVYRVRIVVEGCVWIFCRRVKQVQITTELSDGFIMSVTDPDHSDFRYGRALWQVIDEGKYTRVKYNADFVPAFWVPPLIGSYLFNRRMLKEGKKTVNGIERRLTANSTG